MKRQSGGILRRVAASAAGALHSLAEFGRTPPAGEIFRREPRLDAVRSYVTDTPTFAKLKRLLRAGDTGDLATTLALFEEMEEKDADTMCAASTRRLALTGLDWEVVSAAEMQESIADKTLANDAAEFVAESFTNLDDFDQALEHLAEAIGPNLAVVELVWEGNELAELVPIPAHRLTQRPSDSMDVRIVTAEEALGILPPPAKFVIHQPNARSGWIFKRCISRAQAFLWLVKHLAIADWVTFCEIFGMPARVGRYGASTTTEEKEALADMLENMGTQAWAMVSEAVQIEFKESSGRATAPYDGLINFCTRAITKVWLGGHLTVDTAQATGTYAAGAVQNEVREDIRDDDIRRESRTVRRQIVAPMCAFQYPGRDVPLPIFRRKKPEVEDLVKTADLFERGTQRLGLRVPVKWAHEKLGLPQAEGDEPVIELVSPSPWAEEGPV